MNNKLKHLFFDFILFFYLNYIKEEWEIFNKVGKFFIYPAWYVRSIIMWLFLPIFIIPYILNKKIKSINYLINN